MLSVDGAVSYKFSPPELLNLSSTNLSVTSINPAFEIHESTALKNQQDSISAKMPVVLAWNFPQKSPLETAIFYLSPTYETDKSKSTETYGIDILFSPIVSTQIMGFPIQTGQFIPIGAIFKSIKAEYPGVRLMPYLGFENGYASFPGGRSVYDNQRDFSRFAARLKTDIFLSPRLDIAIDYYHRTFLTGNDDSFDFVDISPILYLDGDPENPETEHFSLGMTFKDGKTTPQFKNVKTISAWIGVKF